MVNVSVLCRARTLLAAAAIVAGCGHAKTPSTTPGSADGAGSAAADKPFDATALASPIEVRVETVALPNAGDCANMTLRVHLKDAHGKELAFDAGTVTGNSGDAQPGFVAAANGAYATPGMSCAGLRQGHTIKADGATLVSVDDWTDEQSGPGTATKVIANLAAGATVSLQ